MKPLSRKVASVEESQTLALSARAKAMKARGIDVISLTAGEPDFPTPQVIKDAAIRAIHEDFTKYTAAQGIPELRQAAADKFRRENDLHFDPSQILVSNGAKHSIYNALQAICNPGDEVIIPAPYWVSYPPMVRLADAKPVIVKTSVRNQFKITPDQLKRALTRRTKAFILCSPCNPTGAVYTREEILGLADVIRRAKIYIISDEIYEKIIYDGLTHFSMGSIDDLRDQVITVNGVSKAYSMTGWRIGYMGARKDIIQAAEKVQSQATSNASAISQRAALAALTADLDEEVAMMVREFDRRRRYLLQEMTKFPALEYIYPRGSFTLFFDVKPYLNNGSGGGKRMKSTEDLCEYILTEHNVAMVPGTGFGAPRWVRISYACSMDDLEIGLERMRRGFSILRPPV